MLNLRVIAIDWSGDRANARRKIWMAEAVNGRLLPPERGRDREELVDLLIKRANADSRLAVGLDFAFSLPEWFLEGHGMTRVEELWHLVDREGEAWLRDCKPPFWGRPGVGRPDDVPDHYRATDRAPYVPSTAGIRPKSVFQIGGAGAVGTGSLRGMPHLLRLRGAGFSIWPFDPPRCPLVIEIYPRLLTGSVVKSRLSDRRAYLLNEFPNLDTSLRELAASTEDAFDAAVSALVMSRHADRLLRLAPVGERRLRLEGLIWHPDLCL